MKRNVIQLAGKTLVISLPARWTKLNNIKKGDELTFNYNETEINMASPFVVNVAHSSKVKFETTRYSYGSPVSGSTGTTVPKSGSSRSRKLVGNFSLFCQ